MALCADPHKTGCMRPVLNDGMHCDRCWLSHLPDDVRRNTYTKGRPAGLHSAGLRSVPSPSSTLEAPDDR
jgi:hypothetical protein